MVPRCNATAFGALPRSPEANKPMEVIITAGLGRARPRRQLLLTLREDRPTLRARAVVSIPPPQATSARPNHAARHNAATVRSDRRCPLRVGVGHADDGIHKIGGAELSPRGACDRDAVDADAAPRPPAKAVLNSLELSRDR